MSEWKPNPTVLEYILLELKSSRKYDALIQSLPENSRAFDYMELQFFHRTEIGRSFYEKFLEEKYLISNASADVETEFHEPSWPPFDSPLPFL